MKYAIVRSGGKQYKVSEGDLVLLERLPLKQDEGFSFPDVLLYVSDSEFLIGNPTLQGINVQGKIISHVRGEKIRVSKFKAKVRYRKTIGHRQELTNVKIEKIQTALSG